jgi:hypothetical protein
MSLVEAGSEPSALLIRTHRVRTLAPLSRNRHHSEPWAPRSFASTNLVGALTWVSVIGSASSSSRETRLKRSRCFGRSRKGLELRHRASHCGDCFFLQSRANSCGGLCSEGWDRIDWSKYPSHDAMPGGMTARRCASVRAMFRTKCCWSAKGTAYGWAAARRKSKSPWSIAPARW